VPKVLMLRAYAPISATPKFCRRSILLRDRFTCQYCGERFPPDQLTYDHLIPRSKGGQTTWENILSACMDCNAKKAASLADFSGRKGKKGSGLRPLKLPRQPTTAELLRNGLECLESDIREDFADWLYWSVELKA
jgi:5-methylcytosine-specific restriction endonuclease McrA